MSRTTRKFKKQVGIYFVSKHNEYRKVIETQRESLCVQNNVESHRLGEQHRIGEQQTNKIMCDIIWRVTAHDTSCDCLVEFRPRNMWGTLSPFFFPLKVPMTCSQLTLFQEIQSSFTISDAIFSRFIKFLKKFVIKCFCKWPSIV